MQIKPFSQLIFAGSTLLLSAFISPSATAQTSLETELLNVLRDKATAYYTKGDMDTYQKYWIQDAHSSRSSIDKFEYNHETGWEDVMAQAKKSSQERGKVDGFLITYDNVHIRTSGTMAFLEVDEHWRVQDKNDTLVTNVHTYAVFMQENKLWKIANEFRVLYDPYTDKAPYREYELNTIGYDLLKEKRVSEAIDLFALIVKQYPTSWNAYDSLGEGYALAGDKKSAIKNYKKSLELNPESEAGKKALAILEKQ